MIKTESIINKIYKNRKISFSNLEDFSNHLKNFVSKIGIKDKEEHIKYFLRDFLKKTFYQDNAINTKDDFDFVVHLGKTDKSKVGVIIETKKPNSKEMITKDNFNEKSMYQSLLYFLRERINNQNNDIKHIVITNFYEWFIFDAADFEKLFFENKQLQKEFNDWSNNKKTNKTTNLFYKEIAPFYIKKVENELGFVYFNIKNINTNISNNQKELIRLYKIFSPEFLLKKSYINDGNTLNKEFYYELLYIIGLEERNQNGKKIIVRSKKEDASLLENAITTIKIEDRYPEVEDIDKFGISKEEQIENIAMELVILWINRIIFLKLLEAQLVTYQNNNPDYKFLNTSTIRDYRELNKLFFAVLAEKHENRFDNLKEKFKKIPYLNSSLFEISKLERQSIRISNLTDRFKLPLFSNTVLINQTVKSLPILKYIFNFLDAYDFTSVGSGELQKEQKNLINSSVLGLIFEKINGYKEGSFFTPGYITMYISRESIREAVIQKFKDTSLSEFRNLSNFEDIKDKIEDRKHANKIINSLKICDPAVGSGHFLVSALNEIIAIKSELGILQYKNGYRIKNYKIEVFNDELIIIDNETEEIFDYNLSQKGNAIPEKQNLQEAIFHEKETIIENCIFGVDINTNSVNICRLRLWIELLKSSYYTKESNYTELETLPNIDINIKVGNSLIGQFALNGHPPLHGRANLRFATRKYKEQIIIYKSTNNKTVKQKAEKEINNIKKRFASNVNPTDEDYKELRSLKAELDELISRSQILMTKEDRKIWQNNLNTLPVEIEKLENKYQQKLKTLYSNAFEWRFEFPEVLDKNGNFKGFDVIIGNPPYIEHKQLHKYSNYFKKNYKIYSGTADISVYFFELALDLIKHNSIFSYITTNKFFRTEYGKNLRNLLSNNQLLQIVDFEQVSVFDKALVSSSIIIVKKKNTNNDFGYSKFEKEKIIEKYLFKEIKKRSIKFNPKDINSRAWRIISPDEEKIINKIENTGKQIKNIKTIQIRRGITTGYDKAFIINSRTYNKLIKKDENNEKIIKPLLKGKDIKKYYYKYDDLWLIYINWHFPLHKDKSISGASKKAEVNFQSNYKALYNYLKKHKNKLTKRNKTETGIRYEWYAMQRQAASYIDFFGKEKIIWALTSNKWGFCLDNEKYFLTSGAFFLISEEIPIKFILAVLNSKLMQFYFSAIGVMTAGGAYTLKKTTIERFTLPFVEEKEINDIIEKTNEIIRLKNIDINTDIKKIESQIDKLMFKNYGLTEKEINIVNDKT